jgi:transcription elongation factor Elf1
MRTTTLAIQEPMPYDKSCAECGKPAQIVITIRDWEGNHNGYPTNHLLCANCALQFQVRLAELLRPIVGNWHKEVVELLQRRQKIDAIRLYRYHTGLSLREAKIAVDALQAK